MKLETVSLEPEIRGLLALGLVVVEMTAAADPSALDTLIDDAVERLRRAETGRSAGQIPRLAAARRLYRAFGIDPTRHRPSPEALIRRLLRGQAFPRIHPAVDLANVWAVESGLPVGLYDLARVHPPVTARRGRAGESYEGIRRGEIRLEGRPLLADTRGPFGNPTADSLRTSVGGDSRTLLYVIFAPTSVGRAELGSWVAWLEARAAERLAASSRAHLLD